MIFERARVSREIRWQGHSLGASLAAAAVGYLCELKANKLIDLDFCLKNYYAGRLVLLPSLKDADKLAGRRERL